MSNALARIKIDALLGFTKVISHLRLAAWLDSGRNQRDHWFEVLLEDLDKGSDHE